ncbi:MAG: SAM-dependent methyltransferase, partial [Nakamurella sp.]
MTTFKASTSAGHGRMISKGRPLTVADIAEAASEGPLPFRLIAFDGSQAGPQGAPGFQLNNRRALTYAITAPGDLGLVRAYVSGDIDFIDTHPADPY